MTQQLNTLTALTKNPDLVPSTHMVDITQTSVTPVQGDSMQSSGPRHCTSKTLTCMQAKRTLRHTKYRVNLSF